jgi:Na+-driven multidrug efflux pump
MIKKLFGVDGPLGLNLLNMNRTPDVLSWHSETITPGISVLGSERAESEQNRAIPLVNLRHGNFSHADHAMSVPEDGQSYSGQNSPRSVFTAFSANIRFSVRDFSIGPRLGLMSPATEKSGVMYEADAFDNPLWDMSMREFFTEAWKWLSTGVSLALNNSANSLIILVNFLVIGRLGDPILQASFGLGISYWYYLSMVLNIATFEVTGIQCSKFFGRRDYEMMSISFFQGLLFQGLITVISFVVFWYCEHILFGIGMTHENAYMAGYMVRWLIPSIVIQAFNFQAISFCVSQGVSTIFGISNFASIVVCTILCPILVNWYGVGILIFPICKFIVEIVNLCVVLYALLFKIEKESLQFVSFDKVMKDFGAFMVFGWQIIMALYVEVFGFEVSVYLAGITHDQYQISAWVCFQNVSSTIYTVGLGFGNVARTNVGNYLGQGRIANARNNT